jgi:hypothetical protein
MSITDNEIQMAFRIKRCVKEFFDTHNQTIIEAKELMPLFIKRAYSNQILRMIYQFGIS